MKGQRTLAWWFLLPSLLVLAGVVAYPFVFNLWISLTNWNMFHFQHPQFQGLEHYAKIARMIGEPFARPLSQWPSALAENEFYRIFGKTFAWTAVNLVFHFTLGLGAALLLNRKPARARPLSRIADPALGDAAVHQRADLARHVQRRVRGHQPAAVAGRRFAGALVQQ